MVQRPPVCSLMCRWSQVFCCPPSEGRELEAAELKAMAARSENRAGHYRQYLFPNGTYWLAWRGRTGHDKNRNIKEVISQIFTFDWKMKGQISKPGQHLYACNLQENVSGINWGWNLSYFFVLRIKFQGKKMGILVFNMCSQFRSRTEPAGLQKLGRPR